MATAVQKHDHSSFRHGTAILALPDLGCGRRGHEVPRLTWAQDACFLGASNSTLN